MKTITLKINERTKAGKAFLEMTNVLINDSKGIELVQNSLNTKEKSLVNRLKKIKKEVDQGTFKGQSVKSFLDEL
jgi:hypothetical protein